MTEPVSMSDRVAALAAGLGFDVDGEPVDDFEDGWTGPVDSARASRWSSKCPDRFVQATLDDLDDITGEPIRAWAHQPDGTNLVLIGDVGTGKTHAALAAARHRWIEHGDDVMFRPVVELLDQLRPGSTDEGVLAEAMSVDVLVLDDVGAERPTDWTAERLFAIVNRRWMERLPIIATSNLDPAALRPALGDRTYSRLVLSGAKVLGVGGDDRRRG